MHLSGLKVPSGPQIAIPRPLYPALHVTAILAPYTPAIDPADDLSELATCVGEQAAGSQVRVLKVPAVEQVAVPPPV